MALGEDENTIAQINIAQEDDSNIFELLQTCFCFYFTFTVYTMFLILQFSGWKRKEKSNLKANPPAIKIFIFVQTRCPLPPIFILTLPPRLIVFNIFSTTLTIAHPSSIRSLRVTIFAKKLRRCSTWFKGLKHVSERF